MAGVIRHQARKRFGQNFLVDDAVIRRISRAIHAKPDDHIVEIGPGHGAITTDIVTDCKQLDVIELDRDLIPMLKVRFDREPGFRVHEADALSFDFASLAQGGQFRVVGNLPYNISTPLIFHLLSHRGSIQDMHFMLQKEVVSRLAAKPGDKNYGRLSVMAQYYCEVEELFEVAPHSFNPAPKVTSAIVRLQPYQQLPYAANSVQQLEHTVKLAFQQRRKTLRNALKPLLDTYQAKSPHQPVDIDLSLRAEKLSVSDFVKLSDQLHPND